MRVLVVDDDIIIRHYFVRSLRRHVDVEEASGVMPALAKIHALPFDIVITDEHMPDGSGRTLLAQVRMLQAHCRRILMSGNDVHLEASDVHERFFAKAGGLTQLVAWVCAVASEARAKRAPH